MSRIPPPAPRAHFPLRSSSTSKTREDGSHESYGYDSGDRLRTVDYGTAKHVEYGVDALGNRVLEDVTTSPSTGLVRNGGTFNGFNQLMKTGGPGSSFPQTNFGYDFNGNLLTETTGTDVKSYAWDKDNRLKSVTPPTGTPTTYSYNTKGLRVQRVDGTGTTKYLLDGPSVLEELDAANAPTTRFMNNPQMIDEVLAYKRGGASEYPLADALGSIYAATDASGAVVHRYEFDVFGARTDLGGSGPGLDVGYTGRWHDATGLINNGKRQRNPLLGSWLQADPMGMVDGPNLYNYVGNQPTMATDPTGQFTLPIANVLAGGAFESSMGAALMYLERGLYADDESGDAGYLFALAAVATAVKGPATCTAEELKLAKKVGLNADSATTVQIMKS